MTVPGRWLSPFLLLLTAAGARAENFALIVGAGQYTYHPQLSLEGPKPDALRLTELLLNKFKYRVENVRVLVDAQASRKNILDGIAWLTTVTKPGDHALIYYSGHGTSSLDTGTHGFGMDAETGAIVPTDIRISSNEAEVLNQLIVGKRDLRKLLTNLEAKAEVLVIFDSCFSGESVKGLGMASSTPRFISLADLTQSSIDSETIKAAEAAGGTTRSVGDYPYRRVVYFSAASTNEYALDINSKVPSKVQGRFNTIDGQSHGAFTNVLLAKLAALPPGGSPCDTLYDSVRAGVLEQAAAAGIDKQHPRMLPESGERPRGICFATGAGTAPPPPAPVPVISEIRQELDRIAKGGGKNLPCKPNKTSYRDGEHTTLICNAPDDGYVTVLSYGEGDEGAVILLPNSRQAVARVNKGEFQIPNGAAWSIRNVLPSGVQRQEQVMVILFNANPIELRALGSPAGIFTNLNTSGTRSFRSQIVDTYDAAELVFPIEK